MTDPLSPDAFALEALVEAAAQGRIDDARWPESLARMVDVLTAEYRRRQIPEPESLARASVAAIAHYQGGRPLYLPRADTLARALRDDEIWRHLGRLTAEQLADQHGLTPARVYQIYAEQQRMRLSKVQARLF